MRVGSILAVAAGVVACGGAPGGGSGSSSGGSTGTSSGSSGAESSGGPGSTSDAPTTSSGSGSTSGTSSSGPTATSEGPTGTDTGTDTGTSAGTTGGPPGACAGEGQDLAPALPTGWIKRWPPPGPLKCDPDYPIAIGFHQGALYVGTNCGEVFRSTDSGATWEPKPTPVVPAMPVPMGQSGPQVWDLLSRGDALFAGIRSKGVLRTLNGGDTWEDYSGGLSGFGPKQVLDLHCVGDALYLATFGGGVFASGFEGADFQPLNTETADPNKQSPSSTCPDTPGYLDPITMEPMTFLHGFSLTDDGTFLYYSNKCGGVYRTALAELPGAASWEGYGAGLPYFFAYFQDPYALASDGSFLFGGIDDEGAYRTPLGGDAQWVYITQAGLQNPKLDVLAWQITATGVYLGTRFGGAYYSATGDSPWTQLNMLPGGTLGDGATTVYGLTVDAERVYAATERGVYVSQ